MTDTLTTLRAALEELDYVDSENASEDASRKVRSAMNMLYTLIAAMEKQEPVGEITAEDMGAPFNAISIRTHFYKEVPAIGTKLYTHAQPVEQPGKCAQCGVAYKPCASSKGCPKCAPGVQVIEAEFQKPLPVEQPTKGEA